MPKRERVQKSKAIKQAVAEAVEQKKPVEFAEAVKADLDALLDEVDSVLEENAEEFVKDYVQKGGE